MVARRPATLELLRQRLAGSQSVQLIDLDTNLGIDFHAKLHYNMSARSTKGLQAI